MKFKTPFETHFPVHVVHRSKKYSEIRNILTCDADERGLSVVLQTSHMAQGGLFKENEVNEGQRLFFHLKRSVYNSLKWQLSTTLKQHEELFQCSFSFLNSISVRDDSVESCQ